MNSRLLEPAVVLLPFGAAAYLLPIPDRPVPVWAAASLLVLAARVLAGPGLRRNLDPSVVPESLAWAAPFSIRILSLLSAPGVPDLYLAAALWVSFAGAAGSTERAFLRRGRGGFAAFAAALGFLSALGALAGPGAAASCAALGAVALLYAARGQSSDRPRPRR
ncbi:MAG: hypothetical protein GX430_04680 [Treponema sp.]|nr:hypothetical protein [Treponema sp.]